MYDLLGVLLVCFATLLWLRGLDREDRMSINCRHDCQCGDCKQDRTKPITKCTCGNSEVEHRCLCGKAIDWSKPVQTRQGKPVKILSTDGPGDYPILGVEPGENWVRMWSKDGRPGYGNHNLIQAPVEHKFFCPTYEWNKHTKLGKARDTILGAKSCGYAVKHIIEITIDDNGNLLTAKQVQ